MAAMIDVAEVRKRLIHTIEQVKQNAVTRRQAVDKATADYEQVLETIAIPVFRHFTQALRAQGYLFQLFTPAGSVRLASDRGADDFIELALDPARQPIAVIGRISYRRGSRLVEREVVIRPDRAIEFIEEDDVLDFLLSAIEPFVER